MVTSARASGLTVRRACAKRETRSLCAIAVTAALAGCGGQPSGPGSRPVGTPAQCQERVVDFIDAAYLEEGDVYEPGATDLALEVRKACRGAPADENVKATADLVRSRLFISQSGF